MANIYWRDIPTSACVIDRGSTYVATGLRKSKTGKRVGRAVVYWSGNEAAQAQRQLAKLAKRPCKR
jgi:hypothetical protein